MAYSELYWLINNHGFAVFIAIVLLWDKLKSNGSLKQTVENNNSLLIEIKDVLKECRRRK